LLWHSQYPLFSAVGIPEINDMVVAEGHRGQGIATAMIAAFEERVRSDGKSTIGIGVGLYADYGSAQRLYARLGYLPDGRGITWNNQPVAPNSSVRVDDELILWLTKHLV
jgi:GNAT superfamily N-acetyltransferase